MKKRVLTMQELIQKNKKEIISNRKELDRIEKKLDERTVNNHEKPY